MNLVNQHIPEDDLALFALALMPPEEAAYTLAHLKHCDDCRGAVARMQGDLAGYAFSAEFHDPSPQARTRLLDAVAQEKKLHVAPPAAEPMLAARSSNLLDRESRFQPASRRGFGFFGWAGWALAAGIAAFAGWQFHQGLDLRQQLAEQAAVTQQTAAVAQQNAVSARENAEDAQQTEDEAARARRVLQALTDPAATQVALHLTTAGNVPPKPEGHASYIASRGELVFVASHLNPVPAGKTYELWILPASGAAPVPAGTFRPDIKGSASLVLPKIPAHVTAKGFGITIEAEGGSTTPTLPILLASG